MMKIINKISALGTMCIKLLSLISLLFFLSCSPYKNVSKIDNTTIVSMSSRKQLENFQKILKKYDPLGTRSQGPEEYFKDKAIIANITSINVALLLGEEPEKLTQTLVKADEDFIHQFISNEPLYLALKSDVTGDKKYLIKKNNLYIIYSNGARLNFSKIKRQR